jgi:hypothetical protein
VVSNVNYPVLGNSECFGFEEKSFWFRLRNRLIGFFVMRRLTPGSSFLDFGGGNGIVSIYLQGKIEFRSNPLRARR